MKAKNDGIVKLHLLVIWFEYYKRSNLYSEGECFDEFYQIHMYEKRQIEKANCLK